MEQGFIDILKQLVKEQVKDVLTDSKQCKALLADYTRNEYKKESRMIVQAVEAGVAKAINGADDLAACKKAKIRDLVEEYGLSQEVAAAIVDTLALVLRGDTSKTVTQVEPPQSSPITQSAKVEPQQSSQTAQAAERPSSYLGQKAAVSNKTVEVKVAFRDGMKVAIINPFVESAYEVLTAIAAMTGAKIKRGNIFLKPVTEPIMDGAVLVRLTGDLEGRVLIDMSKDTALYVASAMIGENLTVFDDLARESIKELAKMISVQAVKKLDGSGVKINSSAPALFIDGNIDGAMNWGYVDALIAPMELE